ncbi:MAG: hypothetical protein ACRCUC_03675 [Aestuariivirga sp.]
MKGHAAKWRLRACILGRLAEHCAAKDHAICKGERPETCTTPISSREFRQKRPSRRKVPIRIRLEQNSGVALTSPPFNLKSQAASVVCEASETSGIVRTIIYRL